MPARRLVIPAISHPSHYHCVSRVAHRSFFFGVHERDVFRKILRQVEGFSGVRVLTWAILSNHFHVLVEVPPRPEQELDDAEILARCRQLYPTRAMREIEWQFEEARRAGIGGAAHQRLREKFLRRMWDLSEFMKTLKQRFTLWYNRSHDHAGTLWESRFTSVLVEGRWGSLMKVAAYIDLNAVRAGLVDDPEDYRWCGYAEAVVGDRKARRGLAAALGAEKPGATWRDVGPRYRKVLFGIGEATSERRGLSREAVAAVWRAGGKLSLAQLLRCQVRYFSAGLVVGSAGFVEEIFARRRDLFSKGRSRGARRMRGGDWEEMRCARALRVRVIDPGGDG